MFHTPNIVAEPIDHRMPENSGPAYPKFGTTVAKLRKAPRTLETVAAHAEALFSQLRALQRSEFMRKACGPATAAPCASRTWHSDGKKILAAVNDQNRRALDGALADSWRRRSDEQVGMALAAALAGEDAPLTTAIYVPSKSRPAGRRR